MKYLVAMLVCAVLAPVVNAQDVVVRVRTRPQVVQTYSTPSVSVVPRRTITRHRHIVRPNVTFQRTVVR